MARSVGAVEVIVNADTGKFEFQLTRGAKRGGAAAAKAINKELSDLRADLDEKGLIQRAEKAAQIIRDQMELKLSGVPISLDLTNAKEDLRELDLIAKAQQLVVDAALSEESLEEINARMEKIEGEDHNARLEITLDEAKTLLELEELERKAEAKLKKDQEKWRMEVEAKLDLDASEAEAEAQSFSAKEFDKRIKLQIEAVDAEREVQEFVRRKAQKRVLLEIELARAEAAYEAFIETQERRALNLPVQADFDRINRDLEKFRTESVFKRGMSLNVGADIAKAMETLRAFEEFAERNPMRVPTDADLTKAEEALALMRVYQEHNDVTIPVDADLDKFERKLAAGRALAEAEGEESGGAHGEGFGRGFIGAIGDDSTLIVGAVLTMGKGIAQGLEGLLSAATSVISSGISAIGGAAGAATPLVAGFAASLGTIIVGSRGFGGAIKAINAEFEAAAEEGRKVNLGNKDVLKSLQNLSPQARATAEAFAEVKGQLTEVRKAVQDKLFAGMADVFRDLARVALPKAQKGMEVLAVTANNFGKDLADIVKKTDFEGVAKGLQPALDDAGDAAKALIGTLEPFLKAASPAAEKLAEMIERVAEGMETWVRANPDKIADFLDAGLDSLQEWGELIANVGDLLATVFQAGKTEGDGLISTLGDIVTKWDQWLESTEGQTAMLDFFDLGREALHDMLPVLEGLKEAFKTLISGDTLGNFESLMDAVGDALPALGQIIALLSDLQLGEAFAEIIEVLGRVAQVINLIPDDILELVGSFAVLTAAGYKVAKSVLALTETFKKLGTATPTLLAISAAVAVGLTVWDKFTDSTDSAKDATRELTGALKDNLDALVAQGDATTAAEGGLKSLNKSIFEAESTGKELEAAFKLINAGAGEAAFGVEDTTRVISEIRKKGQPSIDMLADLAKGYGLPGPEAEKLAKIVDKTDDNFEQSSIEGTVLEKQLFALADAAGVPRDQFLRLTQALESIQDQAQDTDLDALQQGFLDQVSVASEAEQAVLKHGQALQASGDIAAGVGPLYDFVTQELIKGAAATDEATATELLYGDVLDNIAQGVADAVAAEQAKKDARIEGLQAAHDSWVEEKALADMTLEAAAAGAEALGMTGDLAQGFIDVGDSARDAADDADHFKSVIDLLITPAADVEQSFSDLQEAIDEFDIMMKGGQDAIDARKEALEKLADAGKLDADAQKENAEAIADAQDRVRESAGKGAEAQKNAADALAKVREEGSKSAQSSRERADALRAEAAELNAHAAELEGQAHTFDLATEAGREHAKFMRDEAATTLEWAAGMIQAGASTDEVTAKMQIGRATMEEHAKGFGLNAEEAKKYVDTMLGTPKFLETLVSAPGLLDALLNAEELTLVYDEAGNPVITEFAEMGIDNNILKTEGFLETLETLGLVHSAPTVDLTGAEITDEQIGTLQSGADALAQTTIDPTVDIDKRTAEQKLADLQTGINTLAASTAEPAITLPFIDTNIKRVQTLHDEITKLPLSKTVYINVVTRGASPEGIPGLRPRVGGSMAGELITHPTVRNVGERGYREAIIPLDLPLRRVDPSVRELAALLRGDVRLPELKGGKTVNNYMTITPQQADPAIVAEKIINRAASMALRM